MTATSPKPVSVSYNDLSDAYDFVSTDGPFEARAYICLNTGKIYYISDGTEDLEDIPEDIEESDQYMSVPNRYDLNIGRNLVFAFVDEELPDELDTVRDIFRRKGAYGRFKQMLHHHERLDKWHAFEASAVEIALRDWCEDNDIQVSDP